MPILNIKPSFWKVLWFPAREVTYCLQLPFNIHVTSFGRRERFHNKKGWEGIICPWMSGVSNSEGVLVSHYSHFHASPCPCPSWDQFPCLHPPRRCWPCVCLHPMIRILYSMCGYIYFVWNYLKKARQGIYDMKVAIWQKCIHAYPYFWC